MTRRAAALVALGFLAALPNPAHAGDGLAPRTPTLWDDAPIPDCGSVAPACMIVVDRSTDPVVSLPYAIPNEDTEVTPDEVEDSRRHQFLAACRDPGAHDLVLPNWMSQADLDAAEAKMMLTDTYGPEDILDTSSWAGCLERITADDARRPITCDEANMGVDWDTSSVPAGTYKVYGFTWQPELNRYWPREGVVKVVDDPDPAASAPAAALATRPTDLFANDMFWAEVCVSAMDGSTIVGNWLTEPAGLEGSVTPFTETCVVEGGSVALEFDPPEELRGQLVALRVDVTDPMGRSYSAYSRAFNVAENIDQNACPDQGEGGFIADPECHHPPPDGVQACPAPGGGTGDSDGTGGGTDTDSGGGNDPGGACACTAGVAPPAPGWLFLPALAFRRRRRHGS